jgi:hypothetical protein
MRNSLSYLNNKSMIACNQLAATAVVAEIVIRRRKHLNQSTALIL